MVKKIDKKDYLMRFFSLLIAIGLWLYVVYAENPELEFWVRGVSIEYTNDSKLEPNSLIALTSLDDTTVSVRVRGRRRNLGMLTAANVRASVNVGDIARAGNYYLPIDITFNVYGVEVIDKNPYNITVMIDDLVTVKKPIHIDFIGIPRENYSISDYTKSHESVDVTGPFSIVSTITTARAVVDISALDSKKTFSPPISLMTADSKEYSGDMLSVSRTFVNVTTDVMLAKSLNISPQIINSEDVSVNLNISPQAVTLYGAPSALDGVEEVLTAPFTINPENPEEVVLVDLILPPDTVLAEDIANMQVEITAVP